MLKKIAEMLVVALVVAGVAVAFLRIVGSVPISVTQTQKQATFDVTGEGKAVVKPDQAEMTLGVRKESSKVETATEEVDRVMKNLSQELKKLGIEEKDIQTTDYSVYAQYASDGRTAQTYAVNSNVRVVVRDLAKAGQVVDLVGSLGLEQASGLTFTLSETLRDEATTKAREEAIEKAQKKAKELAGLAGMTLGRIVNVQEGFGAIPVPYAMKLESARGGANDMSSPAQVEPGSSTVLVTVTLSYETR